MAVVEPATMLQIPRPKYVGHKGEMHYVATFIADWKIQLK